MNDLFFIDQAYKQAKKAFEKNEVPIGAIIVDSQGNIFARGYNQVEKKQSQIAHAEMQVLAKAAKKMKSFRLSQMTLYVTLQPCLMCMAALYLFRIKRVVYAVESLKFGARADVAMQNMGIYKNLKLDVIYLPFEPAKKLLQIFFRKKRSNGDAQRRVGKN